MNCYKQSKKYEYKILTKQIQGHSCPKCHCEPKNLYFHEAKPRIYQVIVVNEIDKIHSLISRWKCPICGATFTLYPEFAFPYKLYTFPQMLEFSSQYLEEDYQTYRKAVTKDNIECFHQENSGGDEILILAHSTLHRWITSFARLLSTVALT